MWFQLLVLTSKPCVAPFPHHDRIPSTGEVERGGAVTCYPVSLAKALSSRFIHTSCLQNENEGREWWRTTPDVDLWPHIHIHIHSHTHTHTHIYTHSTHTYTLSHTHTHTHTFTVLHNLTCSLIHTHIHTHIDTLYTHTYTLSHIQTHIHTYSYT